MDGDRAPLAEIVELKRRFAALLLLDEAHAVGVLGTNGRGLAAEQGVASAIDVHMGTLSKALGVSGGYICGSRDLIDWLINRARSFIFSTAPPPALAGAALAAVEFLNSPEGEERRQVLCRNIQALPGQLPPSPQGPPPTGQGSAICAWIAGDEQTTLDFARGLLNAGFLVPAIRYPTVARGAARLRITVTASHEPSQIEALGDAMRQLAPK